MGQDIRMFVEIIYNYIDIANILSIIITLILCRSIIYFLELKHLQGTTQRLGIPGPKPSLLKGGNFRDIINALPYRDKYFEWTQEYGKIYGVSFGKIINIVTYDPEIIRKVFIENDHIFTERQDLIINLIPMCKGILFAQNNRWKRMRKQMSSAFQIYGSKLENSTAHVENSISLFEKYLDEHLEKDITSGKSVVKNVEVILIMKAMALNLISQIAIKLESCPVTTNNSVVQKLDQFMEITQATSLMLANVLPFTRRFIEFLANNISYKSVLRDLNAYVNREVDIGLKYLEEKQLKQQTGDEYLDKAYADEDHATKALIHKMIKSHYQGEMTRTELLGSAEAVLIAGYDTTSTTLTYCFWCLGKYLDIQERLRTEIISQGVESPYLTQFLKEVLRRYTVVTSFSRRKANQSVKIRDYNLPKGVNVIMHAGAVHLDPELWPDPYRFDPDRFKEGADIHPYAFVPFGVGQRSCLGAKLAMIEMKYTICNIILKYNIKLVSPLDELVLVPSVLVLTKPKERVIVDFELINQ